MPRSSYKKTKKGIIILYKNIIILIRVDMEAIDQIIGLKGQSCSETISLVVTWLSRPSSPWYFYTYGPPQPTTSQQKMEHLSKLIPKPAMSTSNEKYQLLTRMLQAPRMIGGLMLIPIFTTHFVQAWLPCGLNSYIILYFILLSMAQAHATYWGKLRKCGLEGMGRFLSDLLHEPSPCMLPSG